MMKHQHGLSDFAHYARMYLRGRRRHKAWGKHYERAVRDGSYKLPVPAVVQLLPTEACNLRCAMCNQWGENGYFLEGVRKAQHMDVDGLTRLVRGLSPADSFINVHGGEPFAYKHTARLLELLGEREFDVNFTTNGTLLRPHLEALARIRNLSFLLSIDGDEETHDKIRGAGRFRQAKQATEELYALRREMKLPLPLVVLSFTVCEWTTEAIEKIYDVGVEFGAFAINYNFRWFLTEEVGRKYEEHLQKEFGLKSSGAWRGWLSEQHERHDYSGIAAAITRVKRKARGRLRPPFVATTPSQLRGKDYETYFTDYLDTFGNESCFMPFYWARVHANGDLIYCPGHPDIIVGNVFRDGLLGAFNSELSVKFRKHMMTNRLPICNRCCGLYMTNFARPMEQKARGRLGIPKEVNANFP